MLRERQGSTLVTWTRRVRKILFTRHPWAHLGLSVLVVAVFIVSGQLDPPQWLFASALVLHLLGLVLSLGAVLVIDWTGLAWLAGLRNLRDAMGTAQAARPLVWFGLVALLTSGLFLHPDLSASMPWIKLVAVLLVANNGLVVAQVEKRLRALPAQARPDELSPGLWWRLRGSLVASHLGWWVAVVIGVVTMLARR